MHSEALLEVWSKKVVCLFHHLEVFIKSYATRIVEEPKSCLFTLSIFFCWPLIK